MFVKMLDARIDLLKIISIRFSRNHVKKTKTIREKAINVIIAFRDKCQSIVKLKRIVIY